MPDPTIEILESNDAIPEDTTRVVAKIGKAKGGTANTVYAFTNPALVAPSLTEGVLVEAGVEHVRTAKQKTLLVPCATSVSASVSSVTETPAGSGPTITVSGTPTDNLSVAVKIVKAGLPGVGQFRYALDGVTYGATIDIPARTKATIIGTVDLSGITLSTLNATTLKLDGDVGALTTCTFTTPSDVDDIAVQLNAVFNAVDITTSIRAGRYLVLESDTEGSGSTLSVDSSSTADAILGVSGSATGAESSYELPDTGPLTIGFPNSSAYVLDTVYTSSTTAAAPDADDIEAAIDALVESGEGFALIHVLYEGVDAADCLALATAIGAKLDELEGLGRSVRAIIGAPITATDASIKTFFADFVHPRVVVCVGDSYERGGNLTGSFRRSASWTMAKRSAKYRFSQDAGAGDLPALEGTSLVSPNGTTKARNESTATTKMADFGFTTLETRIGRKGAFVTRGVTRANSGSNFELLKDCRVIDRAFDLALPQLAREQNRDPDLRTNGTLTSLEASGIERSLKDQLDVALVNVTPKHASRVVVAVDRAEVVGTTKNLTADITLQLKGFFKTVTGRLGARTKIESITEG